MVAVTAYCSKGIFCSWNEAVAFERHFWPDCVFKDCYGEHKKFK